MNPRVKGVTPSSDYSLLIPFINNEKRIFDVKPYLDKGVFKELKNPTLFNTVRPFNGSIQWIHEQDFCPDTLYAEGVPV
jgi:hypothetical protein